MRNAIGVAVVGLGGLALGALYLGGPAAVQAVLPEAVAAPVVAVVFAQGDDSPVSGDGSTPGDYLLDGPDGLAAQGQMIAAASTGAVFVRDVVDGYRLASPKDLPAEITTIRPILGCRLTPPLEGSRIGHVTAGAGGAPTALATYTDVDLASAVQAFVDAYRALDEGEPPLPQAPPFVAQDVVITDIAAPVYLVLSARGGDRLWNLHLAPGVRVERVILLGSSQVGVANLDPLIPVEVILDDGLATCGLDPSYPASAGTRINLGPDEGGLPAAEASRARDNRARAIAAYDTWFRDSFGVTASASRIGFDLGSVALVGPVPGEGQPKAEHATLAGAKVRITQDQFFEVSGQGPASESFPLRVRAIATSFAFGDLGYLRQGVRF
jgi:hypothetical protein